jgi:hypothetical protein
MSIKKFLLLLSLHAEVGMAAQATRSDDRAEEALQILATMNSPSALQPASCHGSFGTDIGVGIDSLEIPTSNALLLDQLGATANDNTEHSRYAAPRLWLTRGLPLPIDVSLSASAPGKDGGIFQASGFLQWTIYQALARPALAVRATYGQLSGHNSTKLTSMRGEAVLSYGFWRYIGLYGRGGFSSHQGSIGITPDPRLSYSLTYENEPTAITKSWIQPDIAAGIRLNLGSPFLAVTSEINLQTRTNYTVKLSYLL